jgi:serine/threonine protein kinase
MHIMHSLHSWTCLTYQHTISSQPTPLCSGQTSQVVGELDGALANAKRGAFGGVVKALFEGTNVALKVYNYTGLGRTSCRDAVHEAVLLCKANHPNIVRCYGVVYDWEATAQDSMQGSLVMEWVDGGSLYDWLQDEEQHELGLEGRLVLALQVAEGMRHLVEKQLVHGDSHGGAPRQHRPQGSL